MKREEILHVNGHVSGLMPFMSVEPFTHHRMRANSGQPNSVNHLNYYFTFYLCVSQEVASLATRPSFRSQPLPRRRFP
jgi:hypothetical protein